MLDCGMIIDLGRRKTDGELAFTGVQPAGYNGAANPSTIGLLVSGGLCRVTHTNLSSLTQITTAGCVLYHGT